MTITVTELKRNLGKYLSLARKEDIYITKYGKIIAILLDSNEEKVSIAKSLLGILSDEITLEEAREERLSKI